MKIHCIDCNGRVKRGNFRENEETGARYHRHCSQRNLFKPYGRIARAARFLLRDACC